jgi:hypothetical protein
MDLLPYDTLLYLCLVLLVLYQLYDFLKERKALQYLQTVLSRSVDSLPLNYVIKWQMLDVLALFKVLQVSQISVIFRFPLILSVAVLNVFRIKYRFIQIICRRYAIVCY